MIQKYFIKGLRLRWNAPGAYNGGNRDGSIIQNPAHNAAPMICDGVDGELYNLGAPHLSMLGLAKGKSIPYSWLVYGMGHTTKRMLSAGDVLTGFMSGCLITVWSENGCRYVGHVGTVVADEQVNTRVKATFADQLKRQTIGFNPIAVWSFNEIAAMQSKFKGGASAKIVALVTTGGQFYSDVPIGPGRG